MRSLLDLHFHLTFLHSVNCHILCDSIWARRRAKVPVSHFSRIICSGQPLRRRGCHESPPPGLYDLKPFPSFWGQQVTLFWQVVPSERAVRTILGAGWGCRSQVWVGGARLPVPAVPQKGKFCCNLKQIHWLESKQSISFVLLCVLGSDIFRR